MSEPKKSGMMLLGTADLKASPTNPRKTFDEAKLAELAESVRAHGLLQPVLARPVNPRGGFVPGKGWPCDGYEVVAGERRLRASRLAGLETVLCSVRELTDAEVLEIQLVENDQRDDVRPSEQAAAYRRLVDAVGVAEAAKRIGKSEGAVRGILLLTRMPEALARAVDAGAVSRTAAELVCRVPNPDDRENLAAAVLAGQKYHRRGSKVSENAGEPLTTREVKDLIARQYQVELKTAKFNRQSLDLVPAAPACKECPSRAGNAAALDPEYAALRADVCLDPSCFQAKTDAHNAAEIRAAKESGAKVLTKKESKELFEPYGGLRHNSGYVTLDQINFDAGKTWGELLKDRGKDAAAVAVDHSGEPRLVVPAKTALKIAAELGTLKQAKSGAVKAEPSAAEKKLRAEEILKDKAWKAARKQCLDAAWKTAGDAYDANRAGVLLQVYTAAFRGLWANVRKAVAANHDIEDPDTHLPLDACDAFGLLAEGLVAERTERPVYQVRLGELRADPLLQALGVDPKKLFEDALAGLKSGGGKKAKGTKGSGKAPPVQSPAPAADLKGMADLIDPVAGVPGLAKAVVKLLEEGDARTLGKLADKCHAAAWKAGVGEDEIDRPEWLVTYLVADLGVPRDGAFAARDAVLAYLPAALTGGPQ